MSQPLMSIAGQLAARAREVLNLSLEAEVAVGVVDSKIIRISVDGVNLDPAAWEPHSTRFADLTGAACDGSHDGLCVPLEGGKSGESRCTGCGMVFKLCPECTENSPANIYHAEPLCKYTDE